MKKPEIPEMPPNRILRYDMLTSYKLCPLCGSSLRWFSKHCIQSKCDNYAPAKGIRR